MKGGLPSVGWEGDTHLDIYLDRATTPPSWVVIDTVMTPHQVILRKPTDGLRDLDFRSLCTRLKAAQHKGQGVHTIMERIESRNDAIQDANMVSDPAQMQEAAEHMAFLVAGSRLL